MTADADDARPGSRLIVELPCLLWLGCLGIAKGMTADAGDARPLVKSVQSLVMPESNSSACCSCKAGGWKRKFGMTADADDARPAARSIRAIIIVTRQSHQDAGQAKVSNYPASWAVCPGRLQQRRSFIIVLTKTSGKGKR